MKKIYILLFCCALLCSSSFMRAQTIDTIAIQDFELTPATPTWNFTGPVIYNSGTTTVSAAPPSSPIGIGGSRAWETTTNSGGLILTFDNVAVAPGYDSVRAHFNLAAMNLIGSSGGPDNLDYVLVQYSLDGGLTYTGRMRIRGATTDNCFWEYAATGVAKVYYLPATEALFQPITSGLQTTLGYSNCEIVFPGSITQVQFRITGRSSSSTDTWMIDNVILTGEYTSGTVGMDANSKNDELKLFPNPTEDVITLQFNQSDVDAIVEVLNVLGQTVSVTNVTGAQSTLVLPLEKGVYFIRVNSNDKITTHKIVKQ